MHRFEERRVCVEGGCICAFALIMVPFGTDLVLLLVCLCTAFPPYPVKFSDKYLK